MCWCTGTREPKFKECLECRRKSKWRLEWRKKAEDGVHHNSPCRGWSPSPYVLMRYIIGAWMTFHVSMSEDSARRIVRVESAGDRPRIARHQKGRRGARGKIKMRAAKKQLRHETLEDEVAALWGAEGLDANVVARGGARIVDTHAGGGAICRYSFPLLRGKGWTSDWVDNDIKKYDDYVGGGNDPRAFLVEGDGVDPHHARWVNFIYSPPFSATDLAFARNAELCAEFSAALLPVTWLRKSVPGYRKDLWDTLRAAGRTAVIFTDVCRGGQICQLAWFVVCKDKNTRRRLFKGNVYHA